MTIGLFFTASSSYADLRVGSRPSFVGQERLATRRELMNLTNAMAAAAFSCGMPDQIA